MRLFHHFRPRGSFDQDLTGLVKCEDVEVEELLVPSTEAPDLLTFISLENELSEWTAEGQGAFPTAARPRVLGQRPWRFAP